MTGLKRKCVCVSCEREMWHHAYGKCATCYHRTWTTEEGRQLHREMLLAKKQRQRLRRIEEYRKLVLMSEETLLDEDEYEREMRRWRVARLKRGAQEEEEEAEGEALFSKVIREMLATPAQPAPRLKTAHELQKEREEEQFEQWTKQLIVQGLFDTDP